MYEVAVLEQLLYALLREIQVVQTAHLYMHILNIKLYVYIYIYV